MMYILVSFGGYFIDYEKIRCYLLSMSRHVKYVKQGILSGDIHTWEEIFELYKISWLARDLHMRVDTLRTKTTDISRFEYGDIKEMAKLFEITYQQLHEFVLKTSNDADYKR